MPQPEGVSFVVPVLNGARTLEAALAAILAQADGRPMEVIAIDDGSADESPEILERFAAKHGVRVFRGDGRGAAAAINRGVRHAAHPLICQVDQDVILQPGWLRHLTQAVAQPNVAAAQGRYVPDREGSLWARVMALDVAQRYDRIATSLVNHVCTGNSVYRREALHRVSLLDETLGYGYDNDLSYRLVRGGYRLRFVRAATSIHRWRESLSGYIRQQYGLGYGRLDVVAKHPHRAGGDEVSGPLMMLHAPLALFVLLGFAATGLAALAGGAWSRVVVVPAVALAVPAAERLVAGAMVASRYRDPAGLLFPLAHLLRDFAWAAAILVWTFRRLAGRAAHPLQSMRRDRRPEATRPGPETGGRRPEVGDRRPGTFMALVPAYNEADSLPAVVEELRRTWPTADLVIVDDASTDKTAAVLDRLGVRRVCLTQRLGVGGAVRAGLRYARRLGHDVVVRVDGDGQHAAAEIARLLEPIHAGRADAVIGSRYRDGAKTGAPAMRRLSQRALAWCLSAVTAQEITDPTSGFWAFGPRAVRFLETHHPSGYPEPELRLLLSRNRLRVEEVPIQMRDRLGGRTSLTLPRTGHALARTLLALVVVPLRSVVDTPPHD